MAYVLNSDSSIPTADLTYKEHCQFFKSKTQSHASHDYFRNQFGQLNMLKPIQNKNDYIDEIVGATLIPVAVILETAARLAFCLYDTGILLYAAIASQDSNHLKLFPDILAHFQLAALTFGVGMLCTLSSMLSLITRPIATLVKDQHIVTEAAQSTVKAFYATADALKGPLNDAAEAVKDAVNAVTSEYDFSGGINSFNTPS